MSWSMVTRNINTSTRGEQIQEEAVRMCGNGMFVTLLMAGIPINFQSQHVVSQINPF